jgi:hypothetical protein
MANKQMRNRSMIIRYFVAAVLLLAPSLATAATVKARTHHRLPPQAFGLQGREVAAPPWSAACMTDHGPSECDEPMWVYGTPDELARYKNAF